MTSTKNRMALDGFAHKRQCLVAFIIGAPAEFESRGLCGVVPKAGTLEIPQESLQLRESNLFIRRGQCTSSPNLQ